MSHQNSPRSKSNHSWTNWAMLIEANAQAGVQREISEHKAKGNPVFYEEDIRRRYQRSLTNLPIALQLADNAIIFDNSTNLGHQRKLTIENRKITQQSESLPEWLINPVTLELLLSNQNESTAQS